MRIRVQVCWLILLLLCRLSSAAAPRADALGIDGIYVGTIGMQLDTAKGKVYEAPAKFVVMPDGRAAMLTAQHPGGVLVVVMKGELRGRVLHAKSRGRLDYGGYTQAMRWDITFDRSGDSVVLHGKAENLPKWAKDDDERYVFRRQRSDPARKR